MSFLDGDPVSDSQLIIQCPTVVPSTSILPLAIRIGAAWMNLSIKGIPATAFLDWASNPLLKSELTIVQTTTPGLGL